jgi:hypothetical protein
LSKSSSAFIAITRFLEQTKSPLSILRQRAEGPEMCCLRQICNLRCTSPPPRYARDDDGGDEDETAYRLKAYEKLVVRVNNFNPLALSVFWMQAIHFPHSHLECLNKSCYDSPSPHAIYRLVFTELS